MICEAYLAGIEDLVNIWPKDEGSSESTVYGTMFLVDGFEHESC